MASNFLIPTWFSGYDIFLELIFSIITFFLFLFSLKIYDSTNDVKIKYFGIGFLLISLSYIIKATNNYFTNYGVLNNNIFTIGTYLYIVFMLSGLAFLTYITFKTEKIRVLFFIILISLIGVFLSIDKVYTFYLYSTIYLIILSIHFIKNYFKNKNKKALTITIAFLFLLFGNVHFLLSVNHELFYAIGHILELTAYILIMFNLFLVRKI